MPSAMKSRTLLAFVPPPEAQELIVNDLPYTFLYYPKDLNVLQTRSRNVQMETVGWNYNLEQWWVPKAEQKYP